jgi:hypothetical protein
LPPTVATVRIAAAAYGLIDPGTVGGFGDSNDLHGVPAVLAVSIRKQAASL